MHKKYIKVVKSENWHFEKHSIGKKKRENEGVLFIM